MKKQSQQEDVHRQAVHTTIAAIKPKLLGLVALLLRAKQLQLGRIFAPFGLVRFFFIKPNEKYPASIQPVEVALNSSTEFVTTAYHEMHSWDESSDQVRGASIPQLPLAVVSAGNEGEKPTPGTSPADWEKFLAIWRDLQADLAKRSTNSFHITAAKSSHMIPLDQPAVVVDAIRRVVEAARKHGPLQEAGNN